jgi:hypothetical protein
VNPISIAGIAKHFLSPQRRTCRGRTGREKISGGCAACPPKFPAYCNLARLTPCSLPRADSMPFVKQFVCFQRAIHEMHLLPRSGINHDQVRLLVLPQSLAEFADEGIAL